VSWYYSYYICRKDTEDGKLYPFGPFDYKGNYFDVLCKSRSSASNLYERFYDIRSTEERHMISKELLKAIHSGLSDEDYTEFYEGRREFFWSYLPYNEMPKGEYLKKGYCLIEDIERFEDDECYFEGFYDWLTPEIYAKKLENELKFGAPEPVKDDFGEEYSPHSMRDYGFYRWIDYDSPEYETHVIRNSLGTMREFYELEKNEDIYVVLVQG